MAKPTRQPRGYVGRQRETLGSDILSVFRVGHYGLLQMGRTIFETSHRERVLKVATAARDIIEGIAGMHHHANRGIAIGGSKVLRFEAGYAELEKTTPFTDERWFGSKR
jgi:hypothetical protein